MGKIRAQHSGALAILDSLQRAKCIQIAMRALKVEQGEFDPDRAGRAFLEGTVVHESLRMQLHHIYMSLVYVAIAGWTALPEAKVTWKPFSDATVDRLITGLDVNSLRHFRNAIFHPSPPTDDRQMREIEKSDTQIPICVSLVTEMTRAILSLANSPNEVRKVDSVRAAAKRGARGT